MSSTERLIMEVQKRPCLWDSNLNEFSDNIMKQDAWQEVSKVLYPHLDVIDIQKKNEIIADVRSRWRNVKDYYRRCRKDPKYPHTFVRRKKYIYSDMLQFLDSSMEPRNKNAMDTESMSLPVETVMNSNSLFQPDDETQEEFKIQNNGDFYDEPEIEIRSEPVIPKHHTSKKAKKQKTSHFEREVLKMLSKESKQSEDIDEDKYFLLSLLPEMKKLSGIKKIDFKIAVMKELKNSIYLDRTENSHDGC